jgi:hypothetical protein
MASFQSFYEDTFLDEHRHPVNVVLHLVGVAAGLALIGMAFGFGQPWAALAWPVAQTLPGLVGHRFFERHDGVGDVRVTRRDFPLWWFVVGNHRLFLEVLLGRRPLDARV